MHRSESRELLSCAACGAAVDTRENVYRYGSESALCFECAVERGGSYDATQDRWTSDPDVAGLAREEIT